MKNNHKYIVENQNKNPQKTPEELKKEAEEKEINRKFVEGMQKRMQQKTYI